jgi:hypothetical protein
MRLSSAGHHCCILLAVKLDGMMIALLCDTKDSKEANSGRRLGTLLLLIVYPALGPITRLTREWKERKPWYFSHFCLKQQQQLASRLSVRPSDPLFLLLGFHWPKRLFSLPPFLPLSLSYSRPSLSFFRLFIEAI